MNNTAKLRALKDKHGVTAAHIAKLLGVDTGTVMGWLSVNERSITDNNLELLEFKLLLAARDDV